MTANRQLALALSAAILATAAASSPASAFGVAQHSAVMRSVVNAQRRNNAVINSVQRSIRSSERTRF